MMGPAEGTAEYRTQVEEVFATFKLYGPENETEENNVILLFTFDENYSRAAIMEGLGRYKVYLREGI